MSNKKPEQIGKQKPNSYLGANKGIDKEVWKQEEQINAIIRKYPHMAQHIVKTPFGTILKPSWGKAEEALGVEVCMGKDINKYRKEAKAKKAPKTRVQKAQEKEDQLVLGWELSQEGLRKGE